MGRFIVRRLLAMVLVLFAISVLTFLIFNVIPGGDPAVRLAGKQPQPEQLERIREAVRLRPAALRPVREDDAADLHRRDHVSYIDPAQRGRRDHERHPAHALARDRRGDHVDGVRRSRSGCTRAIHAGQGRPTACSPCWRSSGISMPVFWIGALMNYYLGFKAGTVPQRRLRASSPRSPIDWVYHLIMPWTALSLAVHRHLLARAALQRAGHDERGLRAHGARQGPRRAADPAQATCCATR